MFFKNGEIMAGVLNIVLLSVLGFCCLAISCLAIGLPKWGYFEDLGAGRYADNGYFGPWRVCKRLSYDREKCGREVSKFRPSGSFIQNTPIKILDPWIWDLILLTFLFPYRSFVFCWNFGSD